MKLKKTSLVSSLVSSLVISASATDFTWTGAGSDGDWENPGNWDAEGIPVDDLPDTELGSRGQLSEAEGLSLNANDTITFAGSNMPTVNVPAYGGDFDNSNEGNYSAPTMIFNSGGAITFDHRGRANSFWTNILDFERTVLTIGDGITGIGEEVEVTLDGTDRINRHADGALSIEVNADGTLIMNIEGGELNRWGQFNDTSRRPGFILIDGGTVEFNGSIVAMGFNDGAIDFQSGGGSFSANFGGVFPDMAAVTAALGTSFVNSETTSTFDVTEDGSTFTVTSIPATISNWTGNGGSTWDQDTTPNFTTNLSTDPLVEGTFADAIAATSQVQVTFSDQYFDNGAEINVTNSTVSVDGGVEGPNIVFDNSNVPYTFESLDEFGITGTTDLLAIGDGSLTFRGNHSNTGLTTISPNSILTFDATEGEAWTYTSALVSEGSIEKTGSGSYTLANGAGNSGATTVTAGELILQGGQHSANAATIAAGAILTYESTQGDLRVGLTGTISGDGVLQKTGTGGLDWADATFALSADALIDVQAGTVEGGSSANEDWSANLSDLNIAANAVFTTVEANVFIDTVTGDGTLRSGFDGAGYEELTIGVMNGDATFNGLVEDQNADESDLGALTKVGTGTQTFTGSSTLHGDYTVAGGALVYTSTSSITFYPTLDDTSNQILGEGATAVINIDGAINIDFSETDTTFGNTWVLIDPSSLSTITGPSFNVTSSAGDFSEESPGIWTLDAGGNLWTFTVATGILQLAEGSPLSGFDFFQVNFFAADEIAAGDADLDVDFDGGSLNNGIEFVVGGNPTDGLDDAALAPTFAEVAGGFLFTFRRTDASTPDNPGVEYDADLVGEFTPAIDGTDGVTITVTDDGFEAGVDQVAVFLPDSLAVDGRLFARLALTLGGAN